MAVQKQVRSGGGRVAPPRPARRWSEIDDLALDQILALRRLWALRHHGHAWRLDRFGEGPSRVTLLQLGLDPALRRERVHAICPDHGEFKRDDERLVAEPRAVEVECPTCGGGARVVLSSPAA